jgi:MFS family permease
VLVVLVPLLFWRKRSLPPKIHPEGKKSLDLSLARFVVLFSMLGLGFMLVEISLIQRFTLFLGQPVLSMAALLFSLLVGAGIGSICSGQLASARLIKGLTIASLFIVAILLVYTFLLPLIFEQLLGLGLTVRWLATVAILLPLGFAMGFPFPLGIRLLREMSMENRIPWMWGINGICSVLGSVMTIAIAISLGFTEALLAGTICYFLVFLVFRKRSIKNV